MEVKPELDQNQTSEWTSPSQEEYSYCDLIDIKQINDQLPNTKIRWNQIVNIKWRTRHHLFVWFIKLDDLINIINYNLFWNDNPLNSQSSGTCIIYFKNIFTCT